MLVRAACLILALAAGSAAAQPYEPPISIPGGGPGEPEGPPPTPPRQVFFSPAGEPFRAETGEPYPSAVWFGRADADHDGVLTQAEFTADSLAFFDRLDKDRDQIVDGFENVDYERDIAPEITGMVWRPEGAAAGGPPMPLPPSRAERMYGIPSMLTGGRPKKSQPRRQGAAQFALLNEPHPVRGADSDLDHRVSRAEAQTAARMRYALLDADGDGRLAFADLPKTPVQTMFRNAPAGGRRKAPPKGVEMRLQPAAVNAIPTTATAADSSRETP